MPTDGYAVIGGIEDVGVFQLPHLFQFFENASDLNIDIFATSKFASELIANRLFISPFPHADNTFFIPRPGESERERVAG